ncbi:MAG: RNA polymerase-associated protein RapA, partial [Gammaproteobacteria bacterium]
MSLSQSDFFPGQRWLSEAEADLGLGVVTEYDERMVTIHFPASDETRNYAIRSAPLVRAAFGENDHIEDLEGRPMVVREVQQQGPLLGYLAVDTAGEEHLIPESDLNHRIRLNRPRERLLNGRIDRDIWFDIRYRTWINHERLAKSPVAGLIGPRVSLIPHQLHVANEVTGLSTPRVLLSDEVGLGKTIEAGLILHRLMHNGSLERALILVPETLLHQWLVELLRRFNLRVALFDKERFEAAADYDNPFLSEQLVLTSLSQLTDAPEMARAALGGQWDMLIVDEAHHLHWSESESSLEYDLVSALAEDTPGLMLLTATPEQLGKVGHFGRLRLLDPERFHSLEGFSREEQDYAAVADIGAKLLDDRALSSDEATLLTEMIGEAADLETEEARMQALERLLDRHGTGRVLFRNTRAAISGFPQRRLVEHALPEVAECSANGELLPENAMGEDWLDKDPRVQWLIDTLRELRPEKVLVICAQAETVLALRQALVDREGLHCAVFHEGLSIVERDRAAAYFADPYEGCQALICSEIGSEGRNFQFAHH